MDAKALLRMAVERMTPTQARDVLGDVPVLFTVGRQEYRFDREKGLVAPNGGTVATAMGNITGVRVASEDDLNAWKASGGGGLGGGGGGTAGAVTPRAGRTVPYDSTKPSAGAPLEAINPERSLPGSPNQAAPDAIASVPSGPGTAIGDQMTAPDGPASGPSGPSGATKMDPLVPAKPADTGPTKVTR